MELANRLKCDESTTSKLRLQPMMNLERLASRIFELVDLLDDFLSVERLISDLSCLDSLEARSSWCCIGWTISMEAWVGWWWIFSTCRTCCCSPHWSSVAQYIVLTAFWSSFVPYDTFTLSIMCTFSIASSLSSFLMIICDELSCDVMPHFFLCFAIREIDVFVSAWWHFEHLAKTFPFGPITTRFEMEFDYVFQTTHKRIALRDNSPLLKS